VGGHALGGGGGGGQKASSRRMGVLGDRWRASLSLASAADAHRHTLYLCFPCHLLALLALRVCVCGGGLECGG
jgi:hypothetical protein